MSKFRIALDYTGKYYFEKFNIDNQDWTPTRSAVDYFRYTFLNSVYENVEIAIQAWERFNVPAVHTLMISEQDEWRKYGKVVTVHPERDALAHLPAGHTIGLIAIERVNKIEFDVLMWNGLFWIDLSPTRFTSLEAANDFIKSIIVGTTSKFPEGICHLGHDWTTFETHRYCFRCTTVAPIEPECSHDFTNSMLCLNCGVQYIPPFIKDEDTTTIKDIMEGLFCVVVSDKHEITVWRYLTNSFGWSQAFGGKTFKSTVGAESAILEYGFNTEQTISLLRRSGEISTVHPNSLPVAHAFPKQIDEQLLTWFDMPIDINNLPAHVFRIKLDQEGWFVQQWNKANIHWSSISDLIEGNLYLGFRHKTYMDAVEWLKKQVTPTRPIHLARPTPIERNAWNMVGQAVPDLTTLDDQDRMTITGMTTPEAARALAGKVLAEAVAEVTGAQPIAPAAPVIGTRVAVLDGEDAYTIEEWTADGWKQIAADCDLDQIAGHLRGNAMPTAGTPEMGSCKIEPHLTNPDTFDAFQWGNSGWKQIAGNVTKRTAEGVINARMNDPERKTTTTPTMVTGVVKAQRKLLKEVRLRLKDIEQACETTIHSDSSSIIAIKHLVNEAIELYNQ